MKRLLSLLLLSLATAGPALAQAWPTKPVTLLVPFPPGGSSDAIARVLGSKLQEKLGGSFIVDNRGGAGGTIGTAMVKRAAPDGFTLLVTSLGPLVIGPHLLKNVGYDPTRDLDYISVAVQAPNVLVVPAASPLKSMADVLTYLKANPGKMSFASSGNGSSDHITAELFWQQTGTSGLHIPYKGGGPVMTDLLGNQVESSFMNINTALPQVKAGKLRALAITSTRRSPVLADVPTMDELGIKGVQVYSWQAVAAPKGLPADVKIRLHAGIVAALNAPDVKPKLIEQGFEIVANSPDQFTAFQAAEFARWKQVITDRKITAD
ncbi:Bug family tripartite tricarboxylate transporter substrate binding protein [Roseateles cellulosilyticus]|uniref:Tripartite tricarboxylate transporter substrate binding protein n=1 Tax=Pelomonas cellulosilytica TaxID=2906762 RepID=A0ABS8XQM9_9BURK|nr:tripartite tricarboxylate transporter substrate binding protein [Pelomonas sp. P8]MCE4553048.1 tripartite tricarboxylate transporter substrate binding protein [Pelomonas sp. P8]